MSSWIDGSAARAPVEPSEPRSALVVEDDSEIAQTLQRSLRLEGYEVRLAGDGVAALEAEAVPCGPINDLAAVFANKDYYLRYNSPVVQAAVAAADAATPEQQVAEMKKAARQIADDECGLGGGGDVVVSLWAQQCPWPSAFAW